MRCRGSKERGSRYSFIRPGAVIRLAAALAFVGWCLGSGGVFPARGQDWKWQGVQETFDFHYNPIYGTQGVTDPANRPGGRGWALGWAGADGSLYLYGGDGVYLPSGESGFDISDLWKYDPESNEWTWIKGPNTPKEAPVYGTQGTPDPANTPGTRRFLPTWVGQDGKFYLFGGSYWSNGPRLRNDLWRYDPSTNEWTWLKGSSEGNQPGVYGTRGQGDPANTPGAREYAVSWTGKNGLLYLFGGNGLDGAGNTGGLYDLWSYDPSTNQWTWLKGSSEASHEGHFFEGVYGTKGTPDPANLPGPHGDSTAWTGSDGELYLFGGGDNNDLWRYNPATNEWTWLSGSDTREQPGVYGTQGIPSTENVPGGRRGATGWTDGDGSLYLLGGVGYDSNGVGGYLNDLWKYSISTNQWTWLKGADGVTSPGVYGTQGVPNPANCPGARAWSVLWKSSDGRIFLFGGRGRDEMGNFSTYLNDLWTYDPATNEWTWLRGGRRSRQYGVYDAKQPFPEAPGGRDYASLWKVGSNAIYLFGGEGYLKLGDGGELSDLWKYTPSSNQWTFLKGWTLSINWDGTSWDQLPDGLPAPASRCLAASWTSADNSSLYLFGGYAFHYSFVYIIDDGQMNDLWKYDIVSNNWTQLMGGYHPVNQFGIYGVQGEPSPDNIPGGREAPAFWTRDDGTFYLFGGWGYGTNLNNDQSQGEPLGDLWKYNPATNQWTWVKGEGIPNLPGVYGTRGVANPANTPGGRTDPAFWTGKDHAFYLFGGARWDGPSFDAVAMNDLWKYDPATNEWTWLTGSDLPDQPGVYGERGQAAPGNTPGARKDATTWVGKDGTLFLFGGDTYDDSWTTHSFNDLWKYDPGTNQWTWLQGSDLSDSPGVCGEPGGADLSYTPGSRVGAVGWAGNLDNTVYLFGGGGYDCEGYRTSLGDIWEAKQASALQVSIHPAGAVSAGAQWRRVGTTMWHTSGDYESDLPNGYYTVEFKTLPTPEWSTPPGQTVLVLGLETTSVDGVYVNTYKRLKIVKALLGLSTDTTGLDDNQNGEIDAGDLETLMRLGE